MDSLARRKAALRARMRRMRVAISPQERAASAERVMSRLFDVPALQTARTVLSFSSFGSEVPTDWIARRLHDEGRRVLLPSLEGHDIGVAFAARCVPAVPPGVWYEPVAVVVTAVETVGCRAERRASKPSGR